MSVFLYLSQSVITPWRGIGIGLNSVAAFDELEMCFVSALLFTYIISIRPT